MTEVTRRELLQAATAASIVVAARATSGTASAPVGTPPSKWYENAWRRAVIDMHIPDWDERFFSQFNPVEYASLLARSKAQSIVCYCQSHVGLFNFPTHVGRQHAGWKGRNVLQEMIAACREQKIAVVLYCSLIFDRWAADAHPEWRMRTWEGKIQGEGGRHGVLCMNSPYRDYVRRFTEEICQRFDFEGIRFDMTFWPWLCYCEHCARRFADEVGDELPKTVNWLDEKWVAFQRCRERWLVEFAAIPTETVRKLKPEASVEHQSSTYPLNWMFGVTEALAAQNTFLQGDFYGDQLQGSFVRKLLERLTPNRPFGYETSFSVELKDHTAMKSEALLEAKASAAISDSAAFIFIDAIDPAGTVSPRTHERMGRVFDRLLPSFEHLGGQRVADVAIFHSLESKFNMSANNKHVRAPDTSDAHTAAAMQVASRLIRGHIPFGVITRQSLAALDEFRVLILSNVNMMDEEECHQIRAWVDGGGKLIATGGTSLVDKRGRQHEQFQLGDVFGVRLAKADWTERNHYVTPTADGQPLFPEFDSKYPAFCSGYGFTVEAAPTATVLATTTLPWPAPDATKFSSIHSDPPWRPTNNPELVFHPFGKGAAIYASSLVENMDMLRETFVSLVRRLHHDFQFEIDAPPCVEATLFHQPERTRYVLSLVNFQKELPNIPVDGIVCRLRLGNAAKRVRRIPDLAEVRSQLRDGVLEFQASRLETLGMYAIESA